MFLKEKRMTNFNGAILLFTCFYCSVFATIQLNPIATTQSNNPVLSNTHGARVTVTNGVKTKLSVSAEYMRDHPPNAYCMRIESCTQLITQNPTFQKYETRPFSVGGFNWTFIIEPFGKILNGVTWISAHVAIDRSGLVGENREVFADLRFLVYSKTMDQYWTVRDTEIRHFHQFRTTWGYPYFIRHVDLKAPTREYIFDNDQCVFGVDISVYPYFNKWEVLSTNKSVYGPNSWNFMNFSTSTKHFYISDDFSAGGKKWAFKMYPNGYGFGEGNSLSLYVILSGNQTLKPYEKVYVRAKLRVLNQKQLNYIEKPILSLFETPGEGSGFEQFVSLPILRNPAKGFIVDDVICVQIQFESVSSTKFYSTKVSQVMSSTF